MTVARLFKWKCTSFDDDAALALALFDARHQNRLKVAWNGDRGHETQSTKDPFNICSSLSIVAPIRILGAGVCVRLRADPRLKT